MSTEIVSPFATFAELQREHVATISALHEVSAQERQTRIAEFISRIIATGRTLSHSEERQAAQNILDYWAAERASLHEGQQTFALPQLDPFSKSLTQSSAGPDESLVSKATKGRTELQLGATAKLWKSSGKAAGYLLTGKALEEAAGFRDDSEISELVRASERAVWVGRMKNSIIAGLVGLSVVIALLFFRSQLEVKRSQLQIQELQQKQNALIAEREKKTLTSQLQTQQAQITQLAAELASRNITVPSEITETVPSGVAQAAEADAKQAGIGNQASAKTGFIWVGSNDIPNLANPTTLQPVQPSELVIGDQYRVMKNLVLRADLPTTTTYEQKEGLGVVPQETIVTVRNAPVGYERPTYTSDKGRSTGSDARQLSEAPKRTQYWARVDVKADDQPIVYVEYFGGSEELNAQLMKLLKGANFRVPGVEQTPLAKGLGEIRYFFKSERSAAERLKALLSRLDVSPPIVAQVVDMTGKVGSRNFPGVLELWLDLPGPRPSIPIATVPERQG